jgi:hypothetical protein
MYSGFLILNNEQKLSNRNNCNKINLFNIIYIFLAEYSKISLKSLINAHTLIPLK